MHVHICNKVQNWISEKLFLLSININLSIIINLIIMLYILFKYLYPGYERKKFLDAFVRNSNDGAY